MVLSDATAAAVPPQGKDLPDHRHPAQCTVGKLQDLCITDLLQRVQRHVHSLPDRQKETSCCSPTKCRVLCRKRIQRVSGINGFSDVESEQKQESLGLSGAEIDAIQQQNGNETGREEQRIMGIIQVRVSNIVAASPGEIHQNARNIVLQLVQRKQV